MRPTTEWRGPLTPRAVPQKIKRNRLLVKLVAKKLGNEYFIGHSTIGQHSLQWFQPIVDPSGTIIPQGSINLYQYPMVSLNGQLPVEVAGKMLHAIRWLVHKVAEEPNRVFYRRDASGALPLHALAISNTPSALVLIREICSLWPRMIPLVHGPGLYEGEHLFHILVRSLPLPVLPQLLPTALLRVLTRGGLLGKAHAADAKLIVRWVQMLSLRVRVKLAHVVCTWDVHVPSSYCSVHLNFPRVRHL